MPTISLQTSARVITLALFSAAMAGTWDIWWHIMIGRETFFEPPHILLYGSLGIAIVVSFYTWYLSRNFLMKRVALTLLGIPLLVAPFDEFWHRTFGIENLTSIWIIWSPPHLALVFAVIAAAIFTLTLIRDESEAPRLLLGAALGAVIVAVGSFPTVPLHPLGQFHILGWWGVAAAAAITVAGTASVARYLSVFGAATLTASLTALLAIMNTEVGVRSPHIVMFPHINFLPWTYAFAFCFFGVILDYLRNMHPLFVGAIGGAVWTGILFFGGMAFMPADFAYEFSQASQALIAGTLGGALGWYLLSKFTTF